MQTIIMGMIVMFMAARSIRFSPRILSASIRRLFTTQPVRKQRISTYKLVFIRVTRPITLKLNSRC